ncbi:MAG: zinc ribbon domain-containing protein [Capsulimonadaceae bacterium]
MDNVYEKVCPGCGRSAPLAAKFCSGCGHEYRTVFHDQPAPADTSTSSTPEATNFDARWAPVVAILPVVVVFLFYHAPIQEVRLINQATADTNTVQVQPNPTDYSAEAVPQYGQTPYQVNLSMGKPEWTEHDKFDQAQDWYYARNGRTLKVHFNVNGQVDDLTTY